MRGETDLAIAEPLEELAVLRPGKADTEPDLFAAGRADGLTGSCHDS